MPKAQNDGLIYKQRWIVFDPGIGQRKFSFFLGYLFNFNKILVINRSDLFELLSLSR
jgi:hypothetical protein